LPGHLEMFPGACDVFLREGRVVKLGFLVVLVDEIVDDGTGLSCSAMASSFLSFQYQGRTNLPNRHARVGVLQCGNAAIGVERLVGRRLHVGEWYEVVFMWETKLLQDDCDFPWIGTNPIGMKDHRL
jgi:hypothetical protein